MEGRTSKVTQKVRLLPTLQPKQFLGLLTCHYVDRLELRSELSIGHWYLSSDDCPMLNTSVLKSLRVGSKICAETVGGKESDS